MFWYSVSADPCLCLFTGLKITDTDFTSVTLLQVDANIIFIWCSYIGGNEEEGHFSLINEACSMLVRFSLLSTQ